MSKTYKTDLMSPLIYSGEHKLMSEETLVAEPNYYRETLLTCCISASPVDFS